MKKELKKKENLKWAIIILILLSLIVCIDEFFTGNQRMNWLMLIPIIVIILFSLSTLKKVDL